MPGKARMIVPRMSHALGCLGQETRGQLEANNHAMQRFRNLVSRLSMGQPQHPIKMKNIAIVAARAVLPRKTPRITDEEWKRNALRQQREGGQEIQTETFPEAYNERKIFGNLTPIGGHNFPVQALAMRRRHNILLNSGATAKVEFKPARFIAGFTSLIPVFRVKMVPKGIDQKTKNLLHNTDRDYSNDVIDSIGYFGFTIAWADKTDRPVGVIINRQDRMHGLPKAIQKKFWEWDLEILKVLEQESRRAGLEKLAVVDAKEIGEAIMGRAPIQKVYEIFGEKLRKRGYSRETMKLYSGSGPGNRTGMFWAKNLD